MEGQIGHFQMLFCKNNWYDYGLYAVANATSLAYGRDPTTQVYIPKMMKSHSYNGFENQHIESFPAVNTKAKRKTSKKQTKVFGVPLHWQSICNMADTRPLYIYCDTCSWEYHPRCVGFETSITSSKELVCPKCKSNDN